MNKTIEIRNLDARGALKCDLIDVLASLTDQGAQLRWFIFEIEAVGVVSETNVRDLAAQARENPNGTRIEWSRLLRMAEELDQMINCLIVGCAEGEVIPSRTDATGSNCSVIIEAVDSTFWRVTSRLPGIVEGLQARFEDSEIIPPAVG